MYNLNITTRRFDTCRTAVLTFEPSNTVKKIVAAATFRLVESPRGACRAQFLFLSDEPLYTFGGTRIKATLIKCVEDELLNAGFIYRCRS